MRAIISLFLFIGISLNLFGYYPTVRNFSKSTYQAGAQNWDICQGMGGNMWFANTGILEYDGNMWELTYTGNRTNVRSLYYDRDTDRMYFGATEEFGYMTVEDDHIMKYVSLTDSLSTTPGEIWGIHKIGQTFWLRENNNIYEYDLKEVKQHCFQDKVAISTTIDNQIYAFINNVGVSSCRSGEEFSTVVGTETLAKKRVCSILEIGRNRILYVTATEGAYIWESGKLSPYELPFTDKLRRYNVYCADYNGRYMAFGTVENGVYIHDTEENRCIHLNTFSGLQNNTVLSMCFDAKGNLWLGLDKGIDLIELSSPEYRIFDDPNQYGAGYASEEYGGRLWLGTNQGLYSMILDGDGAIEPINQIQGQVWSLLNHDGRLFCCHDKGLYIIKDGRIRHIPVNGTWKLEVISKYPDYLLGSSYDRLFILKRQGGDWKFDKWIEGFDEASKVFEEDNDGRIWFSHWVKGLFRLNIDFDSGKVIQQEYFSRNEGFPEDWGNTPIETPEGIVFQTAAGFYTFDNIRREAKAHEKLNSMFTSPPAGASLFFTDNEEIYISSGSLQALCHTADGNPVIDSLSLKRLTQKRIVGFEDIRSISDEQLLINTEDGFSLINLAKVKKGRTASPQVYIKEINTTISEKDSCIFSSRGQERDRNIELYLPYRCNTLKFKCACPTYESDNTTLYSYMLENYDKSWSQMSETSFKEYTKLPHGKYLFRVRAKNNFDDKISETQIKIIIEAPWYKTGWAYGLYILMILNAIYVIFRISLYISSRRARIIAARKEEEMKQKQMQLDLEHKAQDLAASTMNVIRKNEILLEIDANIEKVIEYISEDRNRSLKVLGRIRRDIKENIQHDNLWQTFEKNFDAVYNDFLDRLGKQYPALTVSDKKMCAYLRMDLSSKEIAPLLNITVRSVEMTRYRIRKKLGLSREYNLTEFLQKF